MMSCFAALPDANERDEHDAFNYYIGGLTFLSLNDVHWQCESSAFGNFFLSIRKMMERTGDWAPSNSFSAALMQFVTEAAPNMDEDERARYSQLFQAFEAENPDGLNIGLKEVSFMKVFCEAYFMNRVRPAALNAMATAENGN